MQRTWTEVGEEITGGNKDRIGGYLDNLEWEKLEKGKQYPMGPIMAIGEAIKQLGIPKPSHIAMSNEMAPFGLLGIRGHFKNGMAEIFIIDRGADVVVIASDLHKGVEV